MNTWINRINTALAFSFYAIFFLVPLVIYSHSYELFEFNKMWLTFGITIIVGFLWITKMVLLRKIVFRRTPLDIPIFIFLISQFLSTIISLDTHTSIWGYYSRFNGGFLSTLAYLTLYYAMASNLIGKTSGNTENPKSNRQTTPNLRSRILSFLSPQSSPEIPFSYKLLAISLLSGLVVVLWGLPSHFGYDPTCLVFRGQLNVDCWTDAFQPTVRMFSTLGQPNWLAAYLSILLLPLIALFINTKIQATNSQESSELKSKKTNPSNLRIGNLNIFGIWNLVLGILIILFYCCLNWTRSQSGFLGFWAGFALFGAIVLLSGVKGKPNFSKIIREPIHKLIIMTGVAFLIINILTGFPIERLNSFTVPELIKKQTVQPTTASADTALSEVGGTNSGKIRLIVWRGAWNIFKHNPILGSGVETFAYSYYKYRPTEHNQTSEWDYLYNKAHNEYLNYAATSGILGIGSYLLIIGVFLWTSVRYLFANRSLRELGKLSVSENLNVQKTDSLSFLSISSSPTLYPLLALSLIASYFSILVSNFFGFSVVIVNLFFFIIPVMVYELLGYGKIAKPQELPKTDKPVDIFSKAGILVVAVIAIYLLATLMKYWEADRTFALGYNLNRLGEYTAATTELVNATKLRPSEPMFRDELALNLGTVALLAHQSDEATQAAELARQSKLVSDDVIKNHPNNVTFYKSRTRILYGLSQIDPKYIDDAIVSIEKASKLAPTDAKITYNKALFYGKKGDSQKAIELLKQTINQKKDYRDAYYALAVYYLQAAKEASNSAQAAEDTANAKKLLEYSLKNLAPDDPDAQGLLDTIQ